MSKEVKEILEGMKKANNQDCNLWLENTSVKLLYNYITNLQKENEEVKDQKKKAIEYIKEHKDKYYHDWGEDDGSYDTYLDETEIDKLSNILNGGDE